jgi:hypothetical protein
MHGRWPSLTPIGPWLLRIAIADGEKWWAAAVGINLGCSIGLRSGWGASLHNLGCARGRNKGNQLMWRPQLLTGVVRPPWHLYPLWLGRSGLITGEYTLLMSSPRSSQRLVAAHLGGWVTRALGYLRMPWHRRRTSSAADLRVRGGRQRADRWSCD